MQTRFIKYLPVYSVPLIGLVSLSLGGWWTYALVIYVFGLIPVLEWLLPINANNATAMEEELLKNDRIYDYLLYSTVPIQYALLFYFLYTMQHAELLIGYELTGRILTMGILCGGIGINVAHELGHRRTKYEQNLSKALLLTSLYLHFFIEHNRGHHKNVSTAEDPASSRRGEWLYAFWVRSVVGGYFSAWNLERERLHHLGKSAWTWENEMVQFTVIQTIFIGLIGWLFGLLVLFYFLLAAIMGFLLLETVNYIEHYGLQRRKNEQGIYERILPVHSWNSDYVVGRIMLFELTRHSDHHYRATRKYQVLRHFEEAPQMPAGYPSMILLSLVPPLWFYVMHRHIERLKVDNQMAGGALV